MNKPLMGKVVAVWLIENTSLTFKQIANFCGLHVLEVEALADEDSGKNHGLSPIITGELTEEEIKRCEADPALELEYNKEAFTISQKMPKSSISKFKKQSKPEAILWMVQNYSALSNYQIAKLLGATPNVVKAIRERKHWNYAQLKPKNPIALGFCTEEQVIAALNKTKQEDDDQPVKKTKKATKTTKKRKV